MATLSFFNQTPRFDRHQNSMMASLAHRLQVAKAAQNSQLVELLEQEKQQVIAAAITPAAAPSWGSRLKIARQKLVAAIVGESELQVEQFMNGSDRWWYALDPETGKAVYTDSEAELRLWIQANYRRS